MNTGKLLMDHAEELEKKITTIGERWQSRVATQINRRTIGPKWLRFTLAVQQRHQSSSARAGLATAIAQRQQPQRLENGDWQTLGQPPSAPAAAFHSGVDAERPPFSARSETMLAATDPSAIGLGSVTPLPVRRPLTNRRQAVDSATTMPSILHPLMHGIPGRSASDGHDASGAPATRQAAFAVTDGQRLPARTQQLLEKAFHLRTTGVKLHVGVAADTIARRLQADAVTVGDHVFFRAGQYDPTSAPGIGLLGHELTHIAQNRLAEAEMNSQTSWPSRHEQEAAALHNEQQIVSHLARPAAGAGFASSSSLALPTLGSTGATTAPSIMTPQTAASDRNGSAPPPVVGEPTLSPRQLQQIKEAVYRDLMERIRTEFERGG